MLEALCFTDTLFAFDFDGTLAGIVGRPEDARLTPRTAALLRRLDSLRPVAVISGRSLKDVRRRLDFDPRHLIGNHGLEGLGGNTRSLTRSRRVSTSWVSQLRHTLPPGFFESGAEIENKDYSLALHYRRSRRKRDCRMAILKAVARLHPAPRIILGKAVVNLLPPGAPHKGMALLELMHREGVGSAFYIGDDDTDEDVFGLPATRVFSVRVGMSRSSRARFYLKSRSEMNTLLRILIEQLDSS